METIFQVRFLLLALYVQHHPARSLSASQSLGGSIEIARSTDYYPTPLWLLLRFLIARLLVPGGIGFLVCTVLSRRQVTRSLIGVGSILTRARPVCQVCQNSCQPVYLLAGTYILSFGSFLKGWQPPQL